MKSKRARPCTNLNYPGVDDTSVDLTIELGPGATPYNYSDMTGTVSVGTTNPQGFWTYTADGGSTDTFWDRIFWNEEGEGAEPVGTGIVDRGRGARG